MSTRIEDGRIKYNLERAPQVAAVVIQARMQPTRPEAAPILIKCGGMTAPRRRLAQERQQRHERGRVERHGTTNSREACHEAREHIRWRGQSERRDGAALQ